MRLALLASAAFLTFAGSALAQDMDRPRADREPGAASQDMRPDHDHARRGAAMKPDDRAEGGRRDGDLQDPDRGATQRVEERDDRHRDGDRVRVEGDRDRRDVVDHDRVREQTVRDHDERLQPGVARRDVETSVTRRHVSIKPERRTRYRDAFVKTYRERPADVDVRVGARLPREVIIERVPDTYYEDEPDLRGLSYFVDRGHAYLVDPESREVIDDLD